MKLSFIWMSLQDFKEKIFNSLVIIFLKFSLVSFRKMGTKIFNIFSFSFFMLYMFGFQFIYLFIYFEENMRKNREKNKKEKKKKDNKK